MNIVCLNFIHFRCLGMMKNKLPSVTNGLLEMPRCVILMDKLAKSLVTYLSTLFGNNCAT